MIAAGSVIEGQIQTAHGVAFLVLGRPDLPPRIDLAELRGQGIRMETRAPGNLRAASEGAGRPDWGDGLADFACREVRSSSLPKRSRAITRVYVV